jgi:transposase-like protein
LRIEKSFAGTRRTLEIKVLAVIIYHVGISYRRVRGIFGCIGSFSHEALRKWYIKLRRLFVNERRYRRATAVDETKVKLENQWVYV